MAQNTIWQGALLAAALLSACTHRSLSQAKPTTRIDSLSLERSRCFGSCPVYRVMIGRTGAVRISGRSTERNQIPIEEVNRLFAQADRMGIMRLPAVIANASEFCPVRATDHATVTIALYTPDSTYRVVDYLGCYSSPHLEVAPALAALRQFTVEVDRVAGIAP